MKTETWIRELIEKDELWKFYKSKEWIRLKTSVLKAAHYECQECRAQGKITRYDIDSEGNKRLLSTVHHVMHVRDHPELALSRTYSIGGEIHQNLVPVCKACHNKLHPEKRKHCHTHEKTDSFTNEERW